MYFVFETDSDYSKNSFREFKWIADSTGDRSALYRPLHYIGLETGISFASVLCPTKRNEVDLRYLDAESGDYVEGGV